MSGHGGSVPGHVGSGLLVNLGYMGCMCRTIVAWVWKKGGEQEGAEPGEAVRLDLDSVLRVMKKAVLPPDEDWRSYLVVQVCGSREWFDGLGREGDGG